MSVLIGSYFINAVTKTYYDLLVEINSARFSDSPSVMAYATVLIVLQTTGRYELR